MNDHSKYSNDISQVKKKKLDLSNKVNGALVIIFITVFFIDLAAMIFSDTGFNTDFLRSLFALALCVINLILNYYGFFRLSRALLLYLLIFILIFIIPLTGTVMNEYYFWFPYLPVVGSVLPYFLFSEESEKKWLFITLAYYMVFLLLSDNILNYFADPNLTIIPIVEENEVFYKISAMMIFIFINIILYNIFEVSRKYEKGLISAKELLNKRNAELELKNVELNHINATKDKFFHIIGHDLRSPVAQIVQIALILNEKENKLSKNKYDQIIEALSESATLGYNLLNDLFRWAQTQTGEIEFKPITFNLFELVEENIHLMKENAKFKDIRVINKINKTLDVNADVNMLNTVFRNLLSNAIKFTYHHGTIEVYDEVSTNGIKISVKDNGIGMSKDELDKLFKIESKLSCKGTDNEKGSGIGLLLCKEFVDQHKGKIWVESEPEKGSTFTFLLPFPGNNNFELNKTNTKISR